METKNKTMNLAIEKGLEMISNDGYLCQSIKQTLEDRNIFRVKYTPKGNLYLKNIFPDVEGKKFKEFKFVRMPGITYIDKNEQSLACRDVILIYQRGTHVGFKNREKNPLNLKEDQIVTIGKEYLYGIHEESSIPISVVEVFPCYFHLFNKKMIEVIEKIASMIPEVKFLQEGKVDEFFSQIEDKSYLQFEKEFEESFSSTSVLGINACYLNSMPVNPKNYARVGVIVSGEGKRCRHWHIIVKKPNSSIIKCPKEYMGLIIGRGGETIKSLQKKWGQSLRVQV